MKMICNCHGNKSHFDNKGFAFFFFVKVRLFGTQEWPIDLITTTTSICNQCSVICVNQLYGENGRRVYVSIAG